MRINQSSLESSLVESHTSRIQEEANIQGVIDSKEKIMPGGCP